MWTGRTPRCYPTLNLTIGPSWRQSRCRSRSDAVGLPVVGAGRVEPELGKSKNFGLYWRCCPSSWRGRSTPRSRSRRRRSSSWTCRRGPRPGRALDAHLERRGLPAGRWRRSWARRRDAAGGRERRGARRARAVTSTPKERGSSATLTAMIAAVGRFSSRARSPSRRWNGCRPSTTSTSGTSNAPPPREALLERARGGRRAADDHHREGRRASSSTPRRASRRSPTSPSARTTSTSTRRRERGIPVGNTPGVLTDATADIAFALLLAHRPPASTRASARSATASGRRGTRRTWSAATSPDTTLGIVGWGRIGAGDGAPRRGLRDGRHPQLALVAASRSTSCSSRPTTSRCTRR